MRKNEREIEREREQEIYTADTLNQLKSVSRRRDKKDDSTEERIKSYVIFSCGEDLNHPGTCSSGFQVVKCLEDHLINEVT